MSIFDVSKLFIELNDRKSLHLKSWVEYSAEGAQLFDELFVELSELLDVNGFPQGSDRVVVWFFIVVKTLMTFLMAMKPISSLRRRHGFEHLAHIEVVGSFFSCLESTQSSFLFLLVDKHLLYNI